MIFIFLFLTYSLCMTDSSGNLEKWYWWIYFQGRNRDTDVENGHVEAGCGGVELRDWDWFMCTAMKNWWFWAVVLEKTLESPLDCKEIQPVHPKRDQSWIFIGWTDVEAETWILWPPDMNNWLIWKYPDAGKDWGQEEKGTTEDEMVGWHHQFYGHEFG